MREKLLSGSGGFCVWLTGLSGAGKSTIADLLGRSLEARGRTVTVLDGDVVRRHLSAGLGFSREDRDTNILRIGFVASEIVRHGGAVICAAISPYESSRAEAKALVGSGRFLLTYVSTPLAVCEARDPKGLYAKVRRGEIAQFTGIDDPYEQPVAADLVLSTVERTPFQSANEVIGALEARGLLRRRSSQSERTANDLAELAALAQAMGSRPSLNGTRIR